MSSPPEAGPGRRRLVLVVAVLVVVGVAGWWWRSEEGGRAAEPAVAEQGESPTASATDPACGHVLREPAGGAGDHIDDAPISYPAAPPSFGDHRSRWEVRAQTFYSVSDRPEVSILVHNLEHGYNILWYDQTGADDSAALAEVREIADDYASLGRGRDPATAFIAAPWTPDDGDAFPDGTHYALTHWYADPDDRSRSRADEVGLTRYCVGLSAEVVREWMTDYPLRDAPEGFPDLM